MFLRFLAKYLHLPILFFFIMFILSVTVYNNNKKARAQSHYDFIVTSYEDGWCFFGINRENILVANKGYRAFKVSQLCHFVMVPW